MLTQKQAEARGWSIAVEDDRAAGAIFDDFGTPLVQLAVVSSCPLFFLLRQISEHEGDLDTAPITPALVQSVTGESLVEDVPEPDPALVARQELRAKLAAGEASDTEVQQAIADLIA